MTNNIVTVNVTETVAPTPSELQKTGAFLSQGATTGAAGTKSLLTQMSDLTPLLRAAAAITSLTWSGSVVTAATAAPHGLPVGQTISVTIAGATPAGYNGTFAGTITGASGFTYPLVSDPGAETVPGTYNLAGVAELTAMATTFFAQGASQSVYVYELGAGDPAHGVTELSTLITASPQSFYSYLVPRAWADEATFITFVATFEALTAKTYFFVTVTQGNYTSFTPLMKSVVAMIEAPSISATEFSLAAAFWVSLNYDPSSTNKVTPFAFSYLFGETQYPIVGNNSLLATLKAAFINWVGTGAEGGISNTTLFWGTAKDGNDFTYWYSVDWVQINADLDISNAIINGSNNPQNPLYYNQDGINRLQAVVAQLMSSGITFGLVLGDIVQTQLDGTAFAKALDAGTYVGKTIINAVPFIPYSKANPGDYKIGKYSGLSVAYVPQRGFTQIVFNINVSQFVAQ
jgi:hypothetical protein